LDSEPLYWAAAQPRDPRELLADYAFVYELSRHGTHLSPIQRPLLVASNGYWLLPPLAGRIDQHLREPHPYAHDHYRGSRNYYRSGRQLLKVYRYDIDPAFDNAGELRREAALLREPPPGLTVPQLEGMAEHDHGGWLLREWLPGRLLSASIEDATAPAPERVLPQVLAQLASLQVGRALPQRPAALEPAAAGRWPRAAD
jgi:O-antigen chain-terminating bifunctional methyltransferase/kinase